MVVPGHVARIALVEMPSAGEPAQHTRAHLLLCCREIFRCKRYGLFEVDPPTFTKGEHPVDQAAVERWSNRRAPDACSTMALIQRKAPAETPE